MNREAGWTPAVYEELRRVADAVMAGEREGHTLQPTALAHEVWLRLLESRNAGSLEHGALVGVAAQAMRRILTEHARRRAAEKRGGGRRRTTLDGKGLDGQGPVAEPGAFALDLEEALSRLETQDAQLARLVELRFHAGCSTEEIADALEISPRTVKRRWRFARAWLRQQMEGSDE